MLLDVIAVLALVALAVVGLATSFAGWGFLVLAEVAAVLGVLVALSTARWPVAVVVAVAPVVAVLLAGPVALRSPGLGGGIPDAQTFAEVLKGSWTGWGELLTTLAFVDLAGPPAMVPYLLGYAGGLVGSLWALRSRSAGGPVLPLLGVLVVVLLLREPGDGLLEWHPVGFAVVAIAWVAFRGLQFTPERSDDIRGSAHGRVGRGVMAVVVVASALLVAIPLTSGSAASRGESLHGRLGELPDVSELSSPLRNFRAFTPPPPGVENLHDNVLLVVAGAPRGSRVRFQTLDRYDGTAWVADNHTMTGTSEDRFLRMDSRVDNPTEGRRIQVQVGVNPGYRSAWVPTIGSLTSLRFLYSEGDSRREELRYNLATSTAVTPLGLKAVHDYEFTAIKPEEDRVGPRMRPWPGRVLSVKGARRADPLVRRVLASEAPPMRKVFVLAEYLREEGRFSNGAAPGEEQYRSGHDRRRIFGEFLLAPRPVGNDEQYAAAMAVLANRVGVPARVVVGAPVPRDGKVRGSDVEAWVELRVADGSWRTLETDRFMGNRPPRPGMTAAPRPSLRLGGAATPPPPVTPPELAREEQARDRSDAQRRSVLVRLLPWVIPLVLALVVPLTKLVRRRFRRTRGRPSDQMAGAWAELVDHARDLGIPVRPHATRPAQARVLALAGELSRQGDDGVFGVEEPDPEEVSAYWEQVMRERKVLERQQPLLRRLWAPFSPGTLVRRPGSD
jgi:transglutaminase-like putative cysteine protease